MDDWTTKQTKQTSSGWEDKHIAWSLTSCGWQHLAPRGCWWLPVPRSRHCCSPHLQHQRNLGQSYLMVSMYSQDGLVVFSSHFHSLYDLRLPIFHCVTVWVSVWWFFSSFSPCIWTKNSVLMRRAASLSFSFLEPHSESTSSMKMIEGLCWRARSNKFFTSLGETRRDGEKWDWGRPEDSYIPTTWLI